MYFGELQYIILKDLPAHNFQDTLLGKPVCGPGLVINLASDAGIHQFTGEIDKAIAIVHRLVASPLSRAGQGS